MLHSRAADRTISVMLSKSKSVVTTTPRSRMELARLTGAPLIKYSTLCCLVEIHNLHCLANCVALAPSTILSTMHQRYRHQFGCTQRDHPMQSYRILSANICFFKTIDPPEISTRSARTRNIVMDSSNCLLRMPRQAIIQIRTEVASSGVIVERPVWAVTELVGF